MLTRLLVLLTASSVVNGPAGRLFVDDGGKGGVPVVFIPSLAGSTTQWTPQLAHVRRTRRALAIDLRGHGRSDAPRDRRYRLADYAQDVRAALDSLRIRRAVLVGHSMGGGVALAFAAAWPERVAGLLLVDPIDDPSKRPANPAFERFLERIEGEEYQQLITAYWTQILQNGKRNVQEHVLRDLKATPKETMVASMRGMGAFDASAALAAFKGPALTVTTPLNDTPTSLQKVVPGLRHERMTGVSHWLQLDRPEEFNAILDRFLTALPHE
jgi:pimeloyl-ACP methyl ester carboxylesterase